MRLDADDREGERRNNGNGDAVRGWVRTEGRAGRPAAGCPLGVEDRSTPHVAGYKSTVLNKL
jgi:hypothetical protein